MAEDEDDVFEEPDFDDLEEVLKADREEHREQVSLEWVETIREAGEVWRESEDVETVSDEVGLSLERTKEALTVYRLIFEEVPMAVASKSVIPGRSFFSLESEVTTLDPEDEDESVEDLLREYIGAVYLEHDIQEEEVGEPPERETPRSGFEGVGLDLDMSGLFPSFEIPSSTLAAVANMPKIHDEVLQSQVSALAGAVSLDLFRTEQMVASALQPAIAQHQEIFAQSLAPLTAAIEEQQSLIGHSAALALSDAMKGVQFPEPVLADLAAMQPTIDATAAATTHSHAYPDSEDPVVDEASKTSVEAESLEATGEVAPETGPIDATIDSTLPDSDAFSTELAFEIPALVVQSMLGTGSTRIWFNNLSQGKQTSVIFGCMAGIAYSLTNNWTLAGIAATGVTPYLREVLTEDE